MHEAPTLPVNFRILESAHRGVPPEDAAQETPPPPHMVRLSLRSLAGGDDSVQMSEQ
jgi:hypothetical protein